MKQYQKIATFIIRLLGTFAFLFGIFSVMDYARTSLSYTGAVCILLGILVFLASKPLGYIIGKGLDDYN